LQILILQEDQTYVATPSSAVLPRLSAEEAHEWVMRPETTDVTDWKLELRRWIAETLAPRLNVPPDDRTQ
jgi:hypothetical protein